MLTLPFVRGKTKVNNCNYCSPLLRVASSSHPGNLRAPARCSECIFFIKLTATFLFSLQMWKMPHRAVLALHQTQVILTSARSENEIRVDYQLGVGWDHLSVVFLEALGLDEFVLLGWCRDSFGQNRVSEEVD